MSAEDAFTSDDSRSTAELKSSAKWLVGGSASTVAVLVAGVQLSNLDKLGDAPAWAWLVALVATVVTLGAVFWILYRAAAVLATTHPTAPDLEKRESDLADARLAAGALMKPPKDPLLHHLVFERGIELLGPSRNQVGQLVGDFTHAGEALSTGGKVTIQEKEYNASNRRDRPVLQVIYLDLERRLHLLLDAAERFQTQEKYSKLKGSLVRNGALFMVGLLTFVFFTELYPTAYVKVPSAVTRPIQVEVAVPTVDAAGRAGLDPTCVGKVLLGAAIGGPLDAPIVVTRSTSGCSSHRITDTEDLVVIPLPEDPAPVQISEQETERPHPDR